nr:tRNA (adenosine(37)-N6)-threonylcarbamoyltransferase complex ATPase subunit type 1 TsaE [Anaerolineae bacterium]
MKLTTCSTTETEMLGRSLGTVLQDGDIICLSGTLGAGKTSLMRGIAAGWNANERPTSPTFTLVNEYHRQADAQRLFHIDAYRLNSPEDVCSTGLDDILAAYGVVVIEWPERIREVLPVDVLWADIQITGDSDRAFTFSARGPRSQQILSDLKNRYTG